MRHWLPALGLIGAAVGFITDASAGNPYAYSPAAVEQTRAFQYAKMSGSLCLAELRERKVPFAHAGQTRGVQTPIRLTGKVQGVKFVQSYRRDLDPRAPATILDCRLALAIDDLARGLAKHKVVEVEYLSMYRAGHLKAAGTRHPAGRAIDIATAKLSDGTEYSVHHHFYGRAGSQTCGSGAAAPRRNHAGARFWRKVVCQLDATRSFNLILTPNYDFGHRDHLHLEVRSDIRWFLTQ